MEKDKQSSRDCTWPAIPFALFRVSKQELIFLCLFEGREGGREGWLVSGTDQLVTQHNWCDRERRASQSNTL